MRKKTKLSASALIRKGERKNKRLLDSLTEMSKSYKDYLSDIESSDKSMYRNKFLEIMRLNTEFKRLFDNTRKILARNKIYI